MLNARSRQRRVSAMYLTDSGHEMASIARAASAVAEELFTEVSFAHFRERL